MTIEWYTATCILMGFCIYYFISGLFFALIFDAGQSIAVSLLWGLFWPLILILPGHWIHGTHTNKDGG